MNIYLVQVNGKSWYLPASSYGPAVRNATSTTNSQVKGMETLPKLEINAEIVFRNMGWEKFSALWDLIEEIKKIAAELIVDGVINSAGGASCGVLCEEASTKLGNLDMTYGSIFDPDGKLIDDDHAWLISDGDIIDPTITQFSQITSYPGIGEIAVITARHPMRKQYVA